jgi:tRNA(fMet)-specific endonuclease VapC
MRWLLDTNTCIRYLNGRAPAIKPRIDSLDDIDLLVCSIVKAELAFGAAGSTDPVRTAARQNHFLNRFVSLSFDDRCVDHYGSIRLYLSKRGTPIGGNDLMIAAIAVANGVTLVTHNTAEFSRVPGLVFEDWELP